MARGKKTRVLAWPPRDYHWIEGFDDLDRLSAIYAKLEAISTFFSTYSHASTERPVPASDVYGYWFILKDICNDLADILKVDHWTGEIGVKAGKGEGA